VGLKYFTTQQGFVMKKTKIMSVFLLVLVAVTSAQFVLAKPAVSQPAFLYLSPELAAEPADKDEDETDHGYECELIFPFCEANAD
jgi:hypothetical protein